MNWIKRNWYFCYFFVILLGGVWLTAHTQKPSDGASHVMESHKAEATKQEPPMSHFDVRRSNGTYTVEFNGSDILAKWISQHCVAVRPPANTVEVGNTSGEILYSLRCK